MTLPDVDTLVGFGGQLNDLSPVVDPSTDRPASGANAAYCTTAMLTHTVVRAWCRFTTSATTPTLAMIGSPPQPSPNQHDAVWGGTVQVKPTVARTGPGVFQITWSGLQLDELGVQHTLALRAIYVSNEGPVNGFVTASVTPGTFVGAAGTQTAVTINTFNASNAANDLAGTTIYVEVI